MKNWYEDQILKIDRCETHQTQDESVDVESMK